MRGRRVGEIRELLSSADFSQWHGHCVELRGRITAARYALAWTAAGGEPEELRLQLAEQALYRAGEYEAQAATADAELADVEDDSFQRLAAFEDRRHAATLAWERLGASEARMEESRGLLSEARAHALAASRSAGEGPSALSLQGRVRELEDTVSRLAMETERARRDYDDAVRTRDEMWQDVENLWWRAFSTGLARVELRMLAARARAEAEALYHGQTPKTACTAPGARDAAGWVAELRGAGAAYEEHLEQARRRFSCASVHFFLYWPAEDSPQSALCAALVDVAEHLNVQVEALTVYRVDRARGIDFIEPIAADPYEDDPRLDVFFSRGRPGRGAARAQ